MPEHLPHLDSLRDVPVAQPLDAADVRRLGTRHRRRRNAIAVGAGAAVVAAIAGGSILLASNGTDSHRPLDPASRTTASTTPTGGTERLLEDGVLVSPDAMSEDGLDSGVVPLSGWKVVANKTTLDCQPSEDVARLLRAQDLASQTVATTAQGSKVPFAEVRETVLLFKDKAAAEIAFSTAGLWVTECTRPHGGGNQSPDDSQAFDIGSTSFDGWTIGGWSQPSGDCQNCDAGWWTRQIVVQKGDRVLLWQYGMPGGGPNGPDANASALSPVIAAAAFGEDREAISPQEEAAALFWSSDPVESELVGQGDVPDLDLLAGIPDNSGDGGGLEGPAGDLVGVDRTLLCGEPLIPAEGLTGRLVGSGHGPEWSQTRQVISYDSAERAAQVLAQLRERLATCPSQTPPAGVDMGWTKLLWTVLDSDTGYDSTTFGQLLTCRSRASQRRRSRDGVLPTLTPTPPRGPPSWPARCPTSPTRWRRRGPSSCPRGR
jgi:hypothetical protein